MDLRHVGVFDSTPVLTVRRSISSTRYNLACPPLYIAPLREVAGRFVVRPQPGLACPQPCRVFVIRYPFLLPNLVGALLALSALPLVVAYVPETKIDRNSRAERDPINSW